MFSFGIDNGSSVHLTGPVSCVILSLSWLSSPPTMYIEPRAFRPRWMTFIYYGGEKRGTEGPASCSAFIQKGNLKVCRWVSVVLLLSRSWDHLWFEDRVCKSDLVVDMDMQFSWTVCQHAAFSSPNMSSVSSLSAIWAPTLITVTRGHRDWTDEASMSFMESST